MCLVAEKRLSRQVDWGLGLAMVHQESTGSGGCGLGPGRMIDGSWKAGKFGRETARAKSNKERMLVGVERSRRRPEAEGG